MKDISKKEKFDLTSIEITANRFFAITLTAATTPYFLNILTIPTIIIYISLACFLWFGKRYRLSTAITFLFLALIIYFFDIEPLGWGLYRMLRGLRVNLIDLTRFGYVYYLSPIIFVALAFRNFLGNIFSCFKPNKAWRNYFYAVSLVIILVLILGYPLLRDVELRDKTANVPPSGRLSEVYTRQSLTFLDKYNMAGFFNSKFDSSTNKYVYHLQLKEPLKEDIQFAKVELDNEQINIFTDSRVLCDSCQKIPNNNYGLSFPAGKGIDFTVRSDQLIKIIVFTELDNKKTEFIFWK